MLALGFGSIWVLQADEVNEKSPSVKAVSMQEATKSEGASTSPVLGKTIPGLPEYCADKVISVSGCDGKTEITTEQGNTYRLVEIGEQCWFADNLKEIPTTDQGWYGYYDDAEDEPAPGEGLLYTWDAAMNGETAERAQGICPAGYHVPSICEIEYALKNKWKFTFSGVVLANNESYGRKMMAFEQSSSLNKGIFLSHNINQAHDARITNIRCKDQQCSIKCVKN